MFGFLVIAPPPEEFERLERLKEKFERVESITGIPSDILKAISYTLTRYYHHIPKKPEDVPQYGIMGIFKLSDAESIINDEYLNILAGAMLLKKYLEDCGGDLRCALRNYGGEIFLDYPVLPIKNLIDEESPIKPNACPLGPEYPLVDRWIPAHSSNYTSSNRPTRIIVHTTQGSYAGAISMFLGPRMGIQHRWYATRT
jgi:hypothetical protein